MMKYPYELSESRLSLLPLQERNRYRYEHSEYFDYDEKQRAIKEYQEAFNQSVDSYYNALLEENQEELTPELYEEYRAIAEAEANEQAEYIFEMLDELLKPVIELGGLSNEEYKQMSEQIKKELQYNEESLNEATSGPDMTFWMKGIGKWISVGFGAVFGSMAALIMAGKTKAAIRMLEEYMNKIVETIDDGINKRKSSFFKKLGGKISDKFSKLKNWFKKKDDNNGDNTYASFREIQENFLQEYATKAMVMAKNMGFLSDDINKAIEEVEQNRTCQENTGLYYFNQNIGNPINKLANKN